MGEFNNLECYPKTLKLKDLNPGKHNLILMRKIQTKCGDSCIVKLEVNGGEKEYYLKKVIEIYLKKTIKKFNKGNCIFHYKSMIDEEYMYEFEEFLKI